MRRGFGFVPILIGGALPLAACGSSPPSATTTTSSAAAASSPSTTTSGVTQDLIITPSVRDSPSTPRPRIIISRRLTTSASMPAPRTTRSIHQRNASTRRPVLMPVPTPCRPKSGLRTTARTTCSRGQREPALGRPTTMAWARPRIQPVPSPSRWPSSRRGTGRQTAATHLRDEDSTYLLAFLKSGSCRTYGCTIPRSPRCHTTSRTRLVPFAALRDDRGASPTFAGFRSP